jgi:hypothetical protein
MERLEYLLSLARSSLGNLTPAFSFLLLLLILLYRAVGK